MACSDCGKEKNVSDYVSEEEIEKARLVDQIKGPDSPPVEEDSSPELSYTTMLAISKDMEETAKKAFLEESSRLSDDIKAFKIRTFVRIFNGEEFSSQGHSPEFALVLLYRLRDYPEFDKAFELVSPTLSDEVARLYEARNILPLG